MVKYGKQTLFTPEEIIAVGDIHGEDTKLENLLQKILPIKDGTHLVFLGDLINKGKNTPRVLEILLELKQTYPTQVFFIKGNHEFMLIHYCNTGIMNYPNHLSQTLEMFKAEWDLPDITAPTIKQALINKGLWAFLGELLPYYETKDVVCTHAPLKATTLLIYGAEDYEEDYNDREDDFSFRFLLDRFEWNLMWDGAFEDDNRVDILVKKMKICGHQFKHHSRPRIFKNRAYIDTGCGWREKSPLSALIFPGKKVLQGKSE